MGTRRKRPHVRLSRPGPLPADHAAAGTLVETETVLPAEEGVSPPPLAVDHHDPSVHETLLETVSPDSVVLGMTGFDADETNDVVDAALSEAPLPALAVVPTGPVRAPIPRRPGLAVEALNELAEVNATVVTFLRTEGSAAVAHWQALSRARSPGDALRLQVDEIQRAADASLTCFGTLARRAGRLAQAMRLR